MASIHVRIDDKLKKKVQDVLERVGIDLSGAITLYLQHVVLNQKLPFTPSAKPQEPVLCSPHCELCRKYRLRPGRTVNGWTPEQEERMLREIEDALKHGKRYTADALFASWREEDASI